mmetsp:Transcript_75705/g.180905  ORF Transcript_75705/g.180905 Transcript_75705/m.180905 type:complete len:283 (+) Transcript_75705:1361-2209(+)
MSTIAGLADVTLHELVGRRASLELLQDLEKLRHCQRRWQTPHEELKELRDASRSLFSLWPGGHKWSHQKILTVRSAHVLKHLPEGCNQVGDLSLPVLIGGKAGQKLPEHLCHPCYFVGARKSIPDLHEHRDLLVRRHSVARGGDIHQLVRQSLHLLAAGESQITLGAFAFHEDHALPAALAAESATLGILAAARSCQLRYKAQHHVRLPTPAPVGQRGIEALVLGHRGIALLGSRALFMPFDDDGTKHHHWILFQDLLDPVPSPLQHPAGHHLDHVGREAAS